ncbi:MAG: hypothetical protein VX447_19170 [Pseudomonadota bacterium]|uniref:hypothetical protein n=1 Tax=Gallaecimonas pentaromativorans TaxID=584787 RepID=UPI00067E9756|nr:hypothetical protein [Gallaecimonas pentaromativorans]MED5526854.1 hypothetical protein [Pseudomonadota bacterium]
MKFDELGIAKRWRSKKTVAKLLAQVTADEIKNEESEIKIYNVRGDSEINSLNIPCFFSYCTLSIDHHCLAMSSALSEGEWLSALNLSIALRIFSQKLEFFWNYQFYVKRIIENDRRFLGLYFSHQVESMGWLFLLGQIDEAKKIGSLVIASVKRNYCLDFDDEKHRRAQLFMLRLFGLWQDVTIDFPKSAYDVPAYEWLLSNWDIKDEQVLIPAILSASDRHTHQSWGDSDREKYDFGNYITYRCPIEILMLFRLRELKGLTNPQINHPLFESPFDKLPEPQPIYIDSMMQATLDRVRVDWPHFDKVLEYAIKEPLADADYEIGMKYEK